jgi:hypothetical protein
VNHPVESFASVFPLGASFLKRKGITPSEANVRELVDSAVKGEKTPLAQEFKAELEKGPPREAHVASGEMLESGAVEQPKDWTKEQAADKGPIPEGSFSIRDWTGYRTGFQMPEGPFRLIQGPEYIAARNAANQANRKIHAAEPSLEGKQIHDVQPVKFGGDPVDIENKLPLDQTEHSDLTNWWNQLQRNLQKSGGSR